MTCVTLAQRRSRYLHTFVQHYIKWRKTRPRKRFGGEKGAVWRHASGAFQPSGERLRRAMVALSPPRLTAPYLITERSLEFNGKVC